MNILRKILAFVAIMLPMMVGAQSINVKSFEYDPANVTALNNPVNDNMGKPCALIIVHNVGSGGFRFNLNAWYKVETATIDGEKVYLIWLADGTNTMSISNDDTSIEPLKNYHFQRVRSTRVYDMVLENITKPTTSQQFLKFRLSPENATLVVDGVPWAVNNGSAYQLVKLGKHRYEVSAPGYHTDINTVTMDSDEAVEVQVTLQPRFGYLDVTLDSDFGDANVFIDNAVIGSGSIKGHKLDSGTYALMVTHPMYKPYSTTVNISDNQTTTISPQLTANFANMVLQSSDPDAMIYIDSQEVGKGTYRGRMTIGNHTIETRRAGHKSAMQNIEIASAADSRTIALQAPTPIYGSLTIESNPSDATLTIDGKAVGTTPYHSERIIIGDHQIVLARSGYTDHAQSVTITQITPTILTLSLAEKKGFDPNGTFADNLRAAEAGDPEAQNWVGESFYFGKNGASKDYKKAVKWYGKAAEQEDANAQYNLGWCFEHGDGVTKDLNKAKFWYQKAVEQGFKYAKIEMERISQQQDKRIVFDSKGSFDNNLKAALSGDPEAQKWIGDAYCNGINGVSKDYAKAVEWYTKAAEQGDADAQCNVGFCYEKGIGVTQSYTKAVEWYTKAAVQGYLQAQFNLGLCYAHGHGLAKSVTKAVEWWTKAAEKGLAEAQYNLGVCYGSGEGVAQNSTMAVEWWTKAAKQGDVRAQYNLGYSFMKGVGVTMCPSKAIEWWTKAAEQGLADAQYNLGLSYEKGNGVPKDLKKAKYWYQKAVDQGDALAFMALERLKRME